MTDPHLRRNQGADDVLPATRIVAAAVIPFLVAAFAILYLPGDRSADWFAWPIRPAMTAAVMGGGYLAGAYFFARVLGGAKWHWVAGGFVPVTVFTALLLLATVLHRDVFDPGHWAFWVWLALYIVTPLLVPWVWWRNRPADPGTADVDDLLLPPVTRPLMMGVGIVLWTAIVLLFIWPQRAIAVWPWPLTPLTARVMLGWQSLLATGALTMAQERRWSGWRIPLQSIILWQVLVVAAFGLYRGDMSNGLLNWYVLYTAGGLLVAVAFYGWAEMRARRLA